MKIGSGETLIDSVQDIFRVEYLIPYSSESEHVVLRTEVSATQTVKPAFYYLSLGIDSRGCRPYNYFTLLQRIKTSLR